MRRPADQTGFYRKPEEPLIAFKDKLIGVLGIAAFILAVICLLSGCASIPPIIGECINGKVTWSDGTSSRRNATRWS